MGDVLDFVAYAAEQKRIANMPGSERDRIEKQRLEREWVNANTNPLIIGADASD